MLTVRMCFDARSPLTFAVVDAAPGSVVAFVTDGAHLELGGVFAEIDAASCGLSQPRSESSFLVEAQADRTLRRLPPVLSVIAA